MDPKVRDRLDRLAKLVTEYENLNAELMHGCARIRKSS
jgi:hypothetical protein